jgi:hypothetical protein
MTKTEAKIVKLIFKFAEEYKIDISINQALSLRKVIMGLIKERDAEILRSAINGEPEFYPGYKAIKDKMEELS